MFTAYTHKNKQNGLYQQFQKFADPAEAIAHAKDHYAATNGSAVVVEDAKPESEIAPHFQQ